MIIKYLLALFLLTGAHISSAQFVPTVFATVSLSTQSDPVEAGSPLSLTVSVANTSPAFVATGVSVEIQIPAGTSDVVSSDCIEREANILVCPLAELSADGTIEFDITATLNAEGHNQFVALLSGDNLVEHRNTSDSEIVFVEVDEPSQLPVNLAVEISEIDESVSLSDPSNQVTVTVHNLSNVNTSVAPLIETIIPESYSFFYGDDCLALAQVVACRFAMLAPGDSSAITFLLDQNDVDNEATVITSVSSTQPELDPVDNVTQVITSITPFEILCGASNPACSGAGDSNLVTAPDTDEESEAIVDPIAHTTAHTTDNTTTIESTPVASEANSGGGVIGLLVPILIAIVRRRLSL